MYFFSPNRPSDMDKKAPQGAMPKEKKMREMWIDERGVPGYDPLKHGPPRPMGKPSKVPPRRLGSASAVRAQEYAYHLALSSMEIVQLIQSDERGKITLCKTFLLLLEC